MSTESPNAWPSSPTTSLGRQALFAISTRLAGPLKFSSRRSNRLFNSQTSLATTRTRCAGKYGRLFSHIFCFVLLHGRMNGSIPLQVFTALRGVIWRCLNMGSVLSCCGTATDPVRIRGAPEQAYLPGFAPL